MVPAWEDCSPKELLPNAQTTLPRPAHAPGPRAVWTMLSWEDYIFGGLNSDKKDSQAQGLTISFLTLCSTLPVVKAGGW